MTANDLNRDAHQLRIAARDSLPPHRIADVLAAAVLRWRDRNFALRRDTIARISAQLGFSTALLDESLDALLLPFSPDALADLASRVVPRIELLGFVMAGNVVGAGLHEIALALIAGAAVLIKSASREPFFFAEFLRTLAEIDPAVAKRILVHNWPRDRGDLTYALRRDADLLVAYGDDATIDALGAGTRLIGFGSRLSGAIVAKSVIHSDAVGIAAAALARDVTLFEQLGCLSPHHVFVESDDDAGALRFAHLLADAMRDLAQHLPPPAHLDLSDAAALRSIRETARWRSIAGDPIQLIEGPDLSWAVIFDRDASFTPSPGLRCVRVSPVTGAGDLGTRLMPVRGRLEAFAISGDKNDSVEVRELLSAAGVSYLAEPGAIQSPPLTWRHGDGAFFNRMTNRA